MKKIPNPLEYDLPPIADSQANVIGKNSQGFGRNARKCEGAIAGNGTFRNCETQNN
jgi:hypothetical protein